MSRKQHAPVILILLTVALGCSLFSKSNVSEVVLAATEVGTPVGTSTTESIGPAGGSLASPDGRLRLTVPPNAVTETVPFSIQPITNMAANGIGLGYRLEPDGKTFTVPLEISVRYGDNDLEGTIPEALSLAYQDGHGAWHAQKSVKLDQAKTMLTVSTNHFSDWSFLTRVKLSPKNAILHAGESQVISVVLCQEPGFIDKFLHRPANCSTINKWDDSHWSLKGEGTLAEAGLGRVYTAPGKKPTPNVATVVFSIEMTSWDSDTAHAFSIKGSYETKITIVGPGYKASGSDGPVTYSGVICNIEAPFTVTGTHPLIVHTFSFFPSSATSGAMQYSSGSGRMTMNGKGSYEIEGADTKSPEIIVNVSSTARVPMANSTGSGIAHIHLTELSTKECS